MRLFLSTVPILFLSLLHGSQAVYIAPNSTAIAAARELHNKGLDILEFFIALRDLYLSDGFAYGNPFNAAIVGQAKISNEVWTQIRYALEQTRLGIRNGDVGFEELSNLITLNAPGSLTLEPWIKKIAKLIAKEAKNPKDMAHSIRDIGEFLVEQNLNQTSYFNGTYLTSKIATWIQEQFPEETEDLKSKLTDAILVLHHVHGPERFPAISDVLESFPWETNCYQDVDFRMLKFLNDYETGSIVNADQAEKVLTAVKAGFRNYTATSEKDWDTIIDRLVLNDLGAKVTVPVFEGGTIANAQSGVAPRYLQSQEAIQKDIKLLESLDATLSSAFKKGVIEAMQNDGLTMSDIKMALVALAKLLNNLGSSSLTLQKLQELEQALQDDNWKYNLDYMEDLAFRLIPNNAIKIFNSFFALESYPNDVLFPDTKFVELNDMQELLKVMKATPIETVKSAVDSIVNGSRSRMRASGNVFLDLINAYLKITNANSHLQNSLAQDLKLILKWTNSTENPYQQFLQDLIDSSNSTHDGRWSDFYLALQDLNKLFDIRPKKRVVNLAPFKGLEVSGNLIEILQGFRMLVDNFQGKFKLVKLILELPKPLESLEVLGINAKNLERWTHSTRSIDALTHLLRASGSRQNLQDLLVYHGTYTTAPEAAASVELIKNLIQFLETDGGFYRYDEGEQRKKSNGREQHLEMFPVDWMKQFGNIQWFQL